MNGSTYADSASLDATDSSRMDYCRKYVDALIRRGFEVHTEKMTLLTKPHKVLEMEVAAMRMQELRVKHFQREYEMDLAVSTYLGQKSAECVKSDVVAALRKKTEAEELSIQAWAKTRASIAKIEQLESEIRCLERVMSGWVDRPVVYTKALFNALKSDDITFENAFQMAGLDCKCSDPECEYPFVIDDLHQNL